MRRGGGDVNSNVMRLVLLIIAAILLGHGASVLAGQADDQEVWPADGQVDGAAEAWDREYKLAREEYERRVAEQRRDRRLTLGALLLLLGVFLVYQARSSAAADRRWRATLEQALADSRGWQEQNRRIVELLESIERKLEDR